MAEGVSNELLVGCDVVIIYLLQLPLEPCHSWQGGEFSISHAPQRYYID